MRFSAAVVTAFVASATGVTAFTQQSQSTAFVSSRTVAAAPSAASAALHPAGCFCAACVSSHTPTCLCTSCRSINSKLFMASVEEVEATTEAATTPAEAASTDDDVAIPEEVVALDGILSEDEAHNVERPARKSLKKKTAEQKTPLSELKVGDSISGRVKTITSYGAFLDIGAASDGLLHISKLSVDFVSDVNEILKEGQQLNVRIIKIDEKKNQVALTLLSEAEAEKAEQAQSRPQERRGGGGGGRRDDGPVLAGLLEKGWNADQFVSGTVVSTVDFGAFVRVDASELNGECTGSFDGLVHISALAAGRVDSVSSVCKVDDKVQVRVKGIENKKVSLSMVSAEDEAAANANRGSSSASEPVVNNEWKETLTKMRETMPSFVNKPLVMDSRK
ncbi:hypothetical protein MPSEU_000088100 [Mayamaea pseudoterrestris]|nr:hypothetical protein MPSEU_000088100 [Mayamaea pseudoterrestris]